MNNTMNNNLKIYLFTFISFLVGMAQFIFGGILDKVASSVGVSVSSAGQLTTAYSLAAALGTPIFIMLTAKMDKRKQLLAALYIILLGMILTFVIPGFGFLMISRILLGLGGGLYGVCAFSIVAELAPPGRKARALSNLAMGSSAALVFGVPISRIIVASYDWEIIFWGLSLFSLISIFAVARTIPSIVNEVPIPLREQLALLKKPKITISLCVSFFMFVSYSVVNTYIAPFLTSTIPIIEGEISVVLFVLGIASLIGSKLGGFLADRFGAVATVAGGMAVQAITLTLMSIVPSAVIFILPLIIIWAIAAWTCGPILNVNLVSIAPEASGILLSLNGTFIQLGFAAGAGIGGIVVAGASITAITWIGAATVALGVILFSLVSYKSSTLSIDSL